MSDVSFGFGCTRCGFSYGVGVGVGERCPTCGATLVPIENGPPMHAAFTCKHCGFSAGMMVGADRCPGCDTPI